MSTILELKGLSKHFGGVKAIDKFDLIVEKGKTVGLIGPNGAGKTTIFNTITGIYEPTEGEILYCGQNIARYEPYKVAQVGIARTFQNIRLFSNISVLENVIIAGNLGLNYGLVDTFIKTRKYRKEEKNLRDRAEELLKQVNLQDYSNSVAGSLPYGHQRRLEIARALAISPKLLLLDEPAAGMNADEGNELVEFIGQVKEEFDLTIIIIEHHMDVVASLCDYAAVLNFGSKIAEGTMEEITHNSVVLEAYLGKEDLHV